MHSSPQIAANSLRQGVRFTLFLSLVFSCAINLPAQSGNSVATFGAIPDGVMRTDGIMLAGSPVLHSASGSFGPTDAGKYIQVIGAGGGGTSHTDAIMSAGSAVLTSPSGTFVSSDVGRGMVVIGAANGLNLVTTIKNYNSPMSVTLSSSAVTPVSTQPYYYGAMTLEGTVASVENSNSMTLSVPAASTISSAVYAYGTDNHASFQAAVDAAGQAGGGVVNVPAPASCPSGAVCGYVIKASDQMTANAPSAVKIRYSNVSLAGTAPQTNLFCRGAFSSYTNSVAFPNVTGNIRGFCLAIGDNGGPNGTRGETVSNVTISNLHLYGMTNGNTFNVNFAYPPQTPTGDGWDVTHKAIYIWDNGSFSNITIDSVILQDFKAENIYSGGSPLTGMVIKNSSITNFNGNGISMLAADLQVLNNTISNGSNAAVENSTVGSGSGSLVRQLYQGNTISRMPREGIVVVGVDNAISNGTVQITGNYFDTIGQTNGSGTQSAIYIGSQNNFLPPANVTVTGNTCHDCYSMGVLETSGNTLIQGNTFFVDRYPCANFLNFTYAMNGATISGNAGSATAHAQANGLSVGAVYELNPGYASGSFNWKNVVLAGNNWTFPGAPQYRFVTTSGLGWNLVGLDNLNWQGDVCSGCTHADSNHGLVDLSRTTLIEPFGPVVYVNGNSSPTTASIDAAKEENGAQVQIVNAGLNAVTFVSGNNMSLPSPITLAGGGGNSAVFWYSAVLGKFTLTQGPSVIPTVVKAVNGAPQSATVGSTFSTALQAVVEDANSNPISGVNVTFIAPASGASATFGGVTQTSVITGGNGMAMAPTLQANTTAGSYVVTASTPGVSPNALFNLTNIAAPSGGQGLLAGLGDSAATLINLTTEGGSDWIHWGDSVLNRKVSVTPALSSYSVIGRGAVMSYNNDLRPVSWADGTPTIAGSVNADGVYITGVGQGFLFAVPADTTTHTLVVHVGGWVSGGTFRAHLSDNSAVDFTDVTTEVNGQYDRNYHVRYQSGALGQTLILSWTMSSGEVYGNVTLNAAALQGSTSTSTLSLTAGPQQSTAINQLFAVAPQAMVVGSVGVPVPGVAVTFSAPTTGPSATFNGSSTFTATTGSNGIAMAPPPKANAQVGSYSVLTTAAGVAATTPFTLTNTVGAVAGVTATAGSSQNAVIGTSFAASLQALVKDSSGNPLAGIPVLFTAPVAGAGATFGSLASVIATTSANGIAASPLVSANGTTGSYTVSASVAGVSLPTFFVLTNTAVTPFSISVSSGTPQSAPVGGTFGAVLQASVRDPNNNPLAGVAVVFALPPSGPSASFGGSLTASVLTNSSGIATSPSFTANVLAGRFTITASSAGIASPALFALTNTVISSGPGSLSGVGNSAGAPVNLTAEGAADWVHWGDNALSRKATITQQITNYRVVGFGSAIPYNNDLRPISWSDGLAISQSSNNLDGLYTSSVTDGFGFSVPASPVVHTLTVHVGGWLSAGTLTAHLSDGSAPDFTDTTSLVNGQYDRNYTIVFHAASAGQTLQISWNNIANGGNVTLNAAALQ